VTLVLSGDQNYYFYITILDLEIPQFGIFQTLNFYLNFHVLSETHQNLQQAEAVHCPVTHITSQSQENVNKTKCETRDHHINTEGSDYETVYGSNNPIQSNLEVYTYLMNMPKQDYKKFKQCYKSIEKRKSLANGVRSGSEIIAPESKTETSEYIFENSIK